MNIRIAPLALAALLLAAPAPVWSQDPNAGNEVDDDSDAPKRQCLNARRIRDFSVIDRSHVVVSEGLSSHLLMLNTSVCPELRFSGPFVGIESGPSSWICPGSVLGVFLLVRDQRCAVRSAQVVDSVEAAKALVNPKDESEEQGG